jgi:hypothetical protein
MAVWRWLLSLPRSLSALQQLRVQPLLAPNRSSGLTHFAMLQVRALITNALLHQEGVVTDEVRKAGTGSGRQTNESKVINVELVRKSVDGASGSRPLKLCTECNYHKRLRDFEETVSSIDGRTDHCRACLATLRARRSGRALVKLYHLALTVDEAWENAKTCSRCFELKEIRSFGRQLDRTRSYCRSCESEGDSARPARKPVDTPQQCKHCGVVKPANKFRGMLASRTGCSYLCRACHTMYHRELRKQRIASMVVIQRIKKLCTACGQNKLASEYFKSRTKSDGLAQICKECKLAYNKEWRKSKKGAQGGTSSG